MDEMPKDKPYCFNDIMFENLLKWQLEVARDIKAQAYPNFLDMNRGDGT